MGEPDPNAIQVLLIDDHQMFVESLARVLGDDPRIDVVGVASDAAQGLKLAQEHRPRVAIVDFMLPDLDGVELVSALKANDPDLMAVMLTASTDDRVLLRAIDVGCSGFLTKDRAVTEVVDAVIAAADGEALISPAQLARLLPRLSRQSDPGAGTDLTKRELQLLHHLARGQSNKAIAEELHLSVNTIRNYMQSVLQKLDAHSKLEAVAVATRLGLLDPAAAH